MALPILRLIIIILLGFQSCDANVSDAKPRQNKDAWNDQKSLQQANRFLIKPSKICEIPLPEGFTREKSDSLSFESFLRELPLDTIDNTIYAYNGNIISTGGYHYAVLKLDIGKQDLQQCADAVMRLRAEYLYKQKQYNRIHFNFLSDRKPRYYTEYCKKDFSYKKFRKYLDYIFSFANTSSLCDELQKVNNFGEMKIGDVFIQKGNPIGHAVIIVDMAKNIKTQTKIFL